MRTKIARTVSATILLAALFGSSGVSLGQSQKVKVKQPAQLKPTHADVKYGRHERNVLDLYLPESDKATPLVLYIHGGGFQAGDKRTLNAAEGQGYLNAGFAVAAINYRFTKTAPMHLFVNADAAAGELTAEVLHADGRVVVTGLGRSDCVPVRADRTLQAVTWRDDTLAKVAGRPVQFRFALKSARLFAFWVSQEKSGASPGYVAAGGPGLTSPIDTAGRP